MQNKEILHHQYDIDKQQTIQCSQTTDDTMFINDKPYNVDKQQT